MSGESFAAGAFGSADDKWNPTTRAGELEFRSTGSTDATK